MRTIHTALVMAKTKVAPMKRLSIARLELYGEVILAKILNHLASTQEIDSCNILPGPIAV